MRGAIAWPEPMKSEGFALMAGLNLADQTILIFEQFRFWTITHWLNPDGTIRQRKTDPGQYHTGLIQFIQDNEAKYKCSSYFWGGQHIDITTRPLKKLYRNPMLTRHIELIEVPYVSEVGDGLVLEKLQLRAFKADNKSFIHNAVEQWYAMRETGKSDNNIVHCLKCLLAGYEYLPWVSMEKTIDKNGIVW